MMQSLTIFSLLYSLAYTVPLPAEPDASQSSGLVTLISGVFTTPYQCGSYASNNVCASGYACVDGKCVSSIETAFSTSATPASEPSVEPSPAPEDVPLTPLPETPEVAPTVPETPEVAPTVPETPASAPPTPPAPEPVYVPPPPPPTSSTTFTFYEPSTGPAYCDGVYYSSSSYVVALATDILGNRCGQTITIMWGGNSVQATVVDQCNVSHGCRSGNIDSTAAVWNALGANMDIGVLNVQYHF